MNQMKRTILLSGVISFVMALAGSALALVLFLPSNVSAQPVGMRADQLIISSESGADRVLLKGSPGPAEGSIQLIDVNGHTRIGVDMGGPDGTIPNAFGFHLRAEDGTVIGNLGVVNGGDGVSLVLSDHQGHRRINLLVDSDGTPRMQFFDADGNVTWSAP